MPVIDNRYRRHPLKPQHPRVYAGFTIPITRRVDGGAFRYPNYKFRLGSMTDARAVMRSRMDDARRARM